ncbi:MAG: hypothetical protein WC906_02715 [Parcubacteria group bacterium]
MTKINAKSFLLIEAVSVFLLFFAVFAISSNTANAFSRNISGSVCSGFSPDPSAVCSPQTNGTGYGYCTNTVQGSSCNPPIPGTSHRICLNGTKHCRLACTSFTYSGWGICFSSGHRTRTVISSSPAGCSGGTPITTDYCTNGVCNSAYDGQTLATIPASGLCSAGAQFPSSVVSSGPWTWYCIGLSGGRTDYCSANLSAGNCGTSNGQYFLTAPTSDLCLSGTASAFSGTGPWNWTCNGTACSANIKYSNSPCSDVYNYTRKKFESSDLAGTILIGSIEYVQDCDCGIGGLKIDYPFEDFNSGCVIHHNLNVSKTGNGTITSNPSGINCDSACSSANFSYESGTSVTLTAGSFPNSQYSVRWIGCDSLSGNTCNVVMNSVKDVTATITCSPSCGLCSTNPDGCGGSCSPSAADGQCGSAENMTWDAVPDSNLCNSAGGNSTPKVSGGNWTWTCEGTCGGNDKVCSSQRVGYKEVAP